jgi:hypothetical protein
MSAHSIIKDNWGMKIFYGEGFFGTQMTQIEKMNADIIHPNALAS